MWKKIESLLQEKGWTVAELSRQAGVNYPMLAELKSGKKQDMKFSNVVKIADALKVSLEEFREEKTW